MSIVSRHAGTFRLPNITKADFQTFFEAHFSSHDVQHFDAHFFEPENPEVDPELYNIAYEEYAYDDGQDEYQGDGFEEEAEDDGLGYYSDGVKRTLTDEEIAIFRHSEIEALRRTREKQAEYRGVAKTPASSSATTAATPITRDEASDGEEGELEEEPEIPEMNSLHPAPKKSKKKRKKTKNKRLPEPKPDLRKRTWDVVETGLDGLDYDELEKGTDSYANPAAQRRRISYDD